MTELRFGSKRLYSNREVAKSDIFNEQFNFECATEEKRRSNKHLERRVGRQVENPGFALMADK